MSVMRIALAQLGRDEPIVPASGRHGDRAVVELAPRAAAFGGFGIHVGRDASNLSDALQMAVSLIPRDAPGRILVLSDGRWTGPGCLLKGGAPGARCLLVNISQPNK